MTSRTDSSSSTMRIRGESPSVSATPSSSLPRSASGPFSGPAGTGMLTREPPPTGGASGLPVEFFEGLLRVQVVRELPFEVGRGQGPHEDAGVGPLGVDL